MHTCPDTRIYRYQLAKAGNLRKSDGIIVLEAEGGATRYTEYDFFDADWGPLTTLAPGGIPGRTRSRACFSDVAIALKAEHPDWTYKRVSEEGQALLKKYPVGPALEHRASIK